MYKTLFFLVLGLFFVAFLPAEQSAFRLCVKGEKPLNGTVWYSVCASENEFKADRGGRVMSMEFKNGIAETDVVGLQQGTYAVKLFVDLNENYLLDQGAFGYPLEPWGFSNDAVGLLGLPSFERASFSLSGKSIKKVLVNLRGE